MKLKKCSFITDTVHYLGHVVWPRMLKIAFYTTDVIKEIQPTTYATKIRRIFGLSNLFR